MAKTGYSVAAGAYVALVANTAKTVLGVKSGAAFVLDLYKLSITFDGRHLAMAVATKEGRCFY